VKVGERAPYAQRYGREDYKDLAETTFEKRVRRPVARRSATWTRVRPSAGTRCLALSTAPGVPLGTPPPSPAQNSGM